MRIETVRILSGCLYIYNIPHSSRFTYMINNQNVEIIKLVVDFLLKAYSDRALILQGKL